MKLKKKNKRGLPPQHEIYKSRKWWESINGTFRQKEIGEKYNLFLGSVGTDIEIHKIWKKEK